MAQSGLARLTGGQKVAGSNPVAPTKRADGSIIVGFFVVATVLEIIR